MTPDVIATALTGAGSHTWRVESPSRDELRLVGDQQEVAIHVGQDWVSLSTPDTTFRADEAIESVAALQVSARLYMVKPVIDRRGHTRRQVEIPQLGLNREYLHYATDALIAQPQPTGAFTVATHTVPAVDILPMDEVVPLFRTLHSEGWVLKDHAPNQWHAAFVGPERSFDVHVFLNQTWMSFQAPLLPRAEHRVSVVAPELARYLLQMNDVMFWTKFGCTASGQVLLMLDLPLDQLDVSRFRLAARTLATYLWQSAYEIQILADLDQEPMIQQVIREAPRLVGTPCA